MSEKERPIIDVSAIIGDTFLQGGGKLIIDPSMSNEEIGGLIRIALEASDGKHFTVIQSLGSAIGEDLKDLASKFRSRLT